mmetsp:Transcript_14870/g.21278  ORF Transcript_14870/g.21278 Transcript_14870/m.21278 type:complete len:103 (-) Transcript_14870:110-418(-)
MIGLGQRPNIGPMAALQSILESDELSGLKFDLHSMLEIDESCWFALKTRGYCLSKLFKNKTVNILINASLNGIVIKAEIKKHWFRWEIKGDEIRVSMNSVGN